VSAISCWEVAKLVQVGRLSLDRPVLEWIEAATTLHNVQILPLSPEIHVASTQLPETAWASCDASPLTVMSTEEYNADLPFGA
jgi:PIN domain nuclease of toxin-antitoxin system